MIGGVGNDQLAGGAGDGDGDDTLSGIEEVIGSPFADTLVGDAEPNALFGGGGGGDQAFGGSGLDRCLEAALFESCEMNGGLAHDALLEAFTPAYTGPQGFASTLEVDLAGGSGVLTAVVEWGNRLKDEPGIQMHVSFAEGGVWHTDPPRSQSLARAALAQPDGTVVAGGWIQIERGGGNGPGNTAMLLTRYR